MKQWLNISVVNFKLNTNAMDAKILKNIISSTTVPIKNESLIEWQSAKDVEEFPATRSVIIDGLSKTITKLLSYKVSHEAYQRYSVRLHVIVSLIYQFFNCKVSINVHCLNLPQETLRNWSKLKGDIGEVLMFQDSEQSHAFLVYLLKKYMKPENLSMCSDIDHLIQTAEVLLNSIENYRSLVTCFVTVIERIISLNQTDKSEQFLKRVINKSDDLHLELSLIEKIFTNLKTQFVEKPLMDSFVTYCSDKNKNIELNMMNMFFSKVTDSSLLFSLLVNSLRELFVETKFAEVAQSFIQKILEKIQNQCREYHKDILDLYPAHLQFCVVLLRIKPADHSKKSKKQTVQSLQEIFLNDCNDALILISHFPDWLSKYIEFSENLDEV